jgi:hypothetical protein
LFASIRTCADAVREFCGNDGEMIDFLSELHIKVKTQIFKAFPASVDIFKYTPATMSILFSKPGTHSQIPHTDGNLSEPDKTERIQVTECLFILLQNLVCLKIQGSVR